MTGPRLWLQCAIIAAAAIRVRSLRVPALLVLVSFALGNSAVVTGLQFENYKWLHAFHVVSYLCIWVWGLVEGARLLRRRSSAAIPLARRGIVGVLVAVGAVVLIWTPRETLIAPEMVSRNRWQAEVQGLGPLVASFASDVSVVLPLEAQPTLLGATCGVLYDYVHTGKSFISDDEVIQRHVLSAWVLGDDRERLDLRGELQPVMWGETRPRWAKLREKYETAVRETRADALDKFRVRHALTLCARPPTAETGDWRRIGSTSTWCAWERTLR